MSNTENSANTEKIAKSGG